MRGPLHMPLVRFQVAGFDEHTTAPEVYEALAKQLALEDVRVDQDSFRAVGGRGGCKQCEFELPDEEADLLRGPYANCKVAVRGITELEFKEIGPSKGLKADNAEGGASMGAGVGKAPSAGKAASSGKKNAASKANKKSNTSVARPDFGDPNSEVVFPKPKKENNVAALGGMDCTLDSTKFVSAHSSQQRPAGDFNSFPAPRRAPRNGNESSDSDDDDDTGYLRAPERQAAAWERNDVAEAAKAGPSWGPPTAGMPPAGVPAAGAPPVRRAGAAGSAGASGYAGVAGYEGAFAGAFHAVPDTRDSIGPEMAMCTPSSWMPGGEDAHDGQAAPSKTDGVPKTARACTVDISDCAVQ